MACAKKKQDEKNLKTLRQLVSQPGNKECFDCQQRGPTYVNMTIGSFVCTTCSGMLRGLTPPHRVKSISMATFTQEEIDFLKERGNEFCRAIWLGLMPQSTSHSNKDEQKMKDFMSAKYELKRYYLDPAMASQLLSQKPSSLHHSSTSSKHSSSRSNSSSSSSLAAATSTIVKAPPNKSLSSPVPLSIKITIPTATKETEQSHHQLVNSSISSNASFVADFSKVPAPASSPLTIPPLNKVPQPQPIVPQPSFANFENNPIFDSSKANQTTPLSPVSQNIITSTIAHTNGTTASTTPLPPSEDRYAALKDLDSMMKQENLKDEPISNKTSWNLKDNNNAANSAWSAFDQTSSPFILNPFTNNKWWLNKELYSNNNNNNNNNNHHHHNGNNNNFQPFENNVCNTANPFRQTQMPVTNNDSCWYSRDTQENITSSHLSPLSNKTWQPAVTAFRANPFAVGSGIENTTRNSNNPFL
ncbi:arf-GAP domain and FG repeat-containing protein 1 [Copidosoma floridanum]|uniref:arf-GAP domain and FG repeat-containing protein 1 n=1 Tax=Copidosoma floridanum TaxID=29053 RepID=UPI0006C94F4E|nr:arf-GAP domain and FG repeat-containing protein 1 [Copidosoma floridanum]